MSTALPLTVVPWRLAAPHASHSHTYWMRRGGLRCDAVGEAEAAVSVCIKSPESAPREARTSSMCVKAPSDVMDDALPSFGLDVEDGSSLGLEPFDKNDELLIRCGASDGAGR